MRLIVKWFLSDLHINISLTVDLAQSPLIAPCSGSLPRTLPCDAVRASHGTVAETTHSTVNLRAQEISFYFLKFQFWNLNPKYCHGNNFLLQAGNRLSHLLATNMYTQASPYRKATGEIEASIHWHDPCQRFYSCRSQSLSYMNFWESSGSERLLLQPTHFPTVWKICKTIILVGTFY